MARFRRPTSGHFATISPSLFSLQKQQTSWRRGWDSNPRYGYPYNGFRDRPIRPLWHLSGRLDHAPMAVGSGTFIVPVPWRQLAGRIFAA